jgi:Ubiquitin elongating factor core
VLIDFLKALLNDLSYLLDDSLDRIADVQSINAVQNDAAQWQKLSQQEKETRLNFKSGQVRTKWRRGIGLAVTAVTRVTKRVVRA